MSVNLKMGWLRSASSLFFWNGALLGKAGALRGELGVANAVLYVLSRALQAGSMGRCRLYKYYLVAQPVAAKSLLPPSRGINIEIRQLNEMESIAASFPRNLEVTRHRFENGASCFLATKKGQFAGFLWLQSGEFLEDEVRASYETLPTASTVWDFDVFVDPSLRFGMTFPRLWDEANSVMRERGINWSCSRISAFNAGSRAAHARLGTEILASASFLCVGNLQLTMATVSPYLHFSIHSNKFPKFYLDTNRCHSIGKTRQL